MGLKVQVLDRTRVTVTVINNVYSKNTYVMGCLEALSLGPLLFLLYINDLDLKLPIRCEDVC